MDVDRKHGGQRPITGEAEEVEQAQEDEVASPEGSSRSLGSEWALQL